MSTFQPTKSEFDMCLKFFVSQAQNMINAFYTRNFPTLKAPTLQVEPGRRYTKITSVGLQIMVWAFVDANGDILKPASFKAPAKHARGSIFNDNPLTGVGVHGPNYMK